MLKISDKKRKSIDASQRAAESQGFAAEWGGRMVRLWVKQWITARELPSSKRGCHGKVYSLLDGPEICTELQSYLHSNKWSMDPAKLAKFTKDKLIPEEASQYLCQIVEHEMPNGLKQYMELELFPHIQMKVAKGISLSTACRWLVKEGFKYTAHKKALYYDGHERPDVTLYHQETFIPSMKAYDRCLVKYVVGQVENEEPLTCFKVETKLVLCAHDEMTAQANDGQKMSWIWKGEQPLKKKGLGRGLHQSDFICSTVGWLKDASQTLEYGKNYEGYWNGELFVKQLKERFFSAFEAAHGPGYQALVLIDNSQGHSAYAEDALLTSRMNMRPGGKQANLRDGWFMNNGQKLIQKMNFPENHPQYPSQPKGMQ
ncbi:hypothetical protein M422DRAFT_259146 [Sphaerobolus stellatus SS14]|uniref:DDE-1 domain-containing protein n=1 Tax=Sphaerobolus stellatus (strain SS14) TaxID=990650 RepID=A0A0C9VL02_SPHS4|nr:hypothetical protein M422DRAFT_259146 [Sphaerobolus stellatus SS14]